MEPAIPRRDLLGAALGMTAFAAFARGSVARAQEAAGAAGDRPPEAIARDESLWLSVRAAFVLDPSITYLNNAGLHPASRSVHEAVKACLDASNLAPAHALWDVLAPRVEEARRRLAATFGCDPEELALTRNATEALEICQLGLDLQRGDEVLTTTEDYSHMLDTWRQRERRDGIVLKAISFPLPPPSPDDLVERFERAITPKTRVIALCHVTTRTGQIFPVKKICAMARARSVETIVDGAQAFGLLPFRQGDVDADYYGTSLHKWLGAPVGAGFLHVRRARIEKLWPLFPAPAAKATDIRKLEAIGTHPLAVLLATGDALAFHESLGAERKAARLRYLRERWTERLARLQGARMLTSSDPAQSCAIGYVSFAGVDHDALARRLLEKHRIYVAPFWHEESPGIRVSPGIYTTAKEIDAFASAVEDELRG